MHAPVMQLTGSAEADRNAVTWAIKEAMSASGALLLDARIFSNISTCFTFEVRAGDVAPLAAALAATDLRLGDASVAALAAIVARVTTGEIHPDAELAGTLNVTFVHDDPDPALDVPAVPG